MRVRLLGTGSADGWPNPWCACGSCSAAAAQGVVRGQTSVLVDDRLLVDLGPDGPRAAVRQGVSLARVEAVLVTHAHEDHHGPAAWMWRGWSTPRGPLQLCAPPAVLAAADRLDGSVTTRAVHPGDRFEVAGYDVVALPAEHPGGAVLYDVTGPDGGRLLYATDTGVLPAAAVDLAAGREYDVVLLELAGTAIPSHLTMGTWPDQLSRLRAAGAVTERTQVLAVHLGHGNPPPDRLDRWLAAHGARAGRDGELVRTRGGRRVLVLGGQSSGKSAWAERQVTGPVTYVATAPPREGDDEWAARVDAHVRRRPADWCTVETGDVAGVLRSVSGPVLVDDLGLWLVQVLDGLWDDRHAARAAFDAALTDLLDAWSHTDAHVVLVAPEVGSGVVPGTLSGRLFADLLGRASTALAEHSDEVVQVVAGQARRLR